MDNLFINIVLGVVGLCLYFTFAFILNMFLAFKFTGFKLPIAYKYIDKKEPIYKLVGRDLGEFYVIQKWILDYDDVDEKYWFLIPFSGLFKKYQYTCVGERGMFNSDEIKNIISLAKSYEALVVIESSFKAKPEIVDKLNKDFNDNYIE